MRSGLPGAATAQPYVFAVLVVTSLLPYAALPVGASTGLQLAELVAALALLVLPQSRRSWVWLVLAGPFWLSAAYHASADPRVDPGLEIRNCVVASVVLVAVCAGAATTAATLRRGADAASVLLALHLGVGLVQERAFAAARFPLTALFSTNPSFGSYDLAGAPYALYVRRPFGWMPEPSAMAAAVGPVVVLLALLASSRDVPCGARVRWGAGATCGAALIVLSGSGYSVFLAAALILVGVRAVVQEGFRPHRMLPRPVLAAVTGLGLPLLVTGVGVLTVERLTRTSTSYQSRSTSVVSGLRLLREQLPLGVGPGESSHLLAESGVRVADQFGAYPANAVDSVLVRYVVETGLVGAAALVAVAALVVHAARRSADPWGAAAVAVALFTALTFATSYLELITPWTVLGVLLSWHRARPGTCGCSTSSPASRSAAPRSSSPGSRPAAATTSSS